MDDEQRDETITSLQWRVIRKRRQAKRARDLMRRAKLIAQVLDLEDKIAELRAADEAL